MYKYCITSLYIQYIYSSSHSPGSALYPASSSLSSPALRLSRATPSTNRLLFSSSRMPSRDLQ